MIRRAALAFLVAVTGTASAARIPEPGEVDHRIRSTIYNPNQVYELAGFFGYHSIIVFGPGEQILRTETFNSGWTVDDLGGKLLVTPKAPDADTNLTVITNKRLYSFELRTVPFPKGSYRSQAKDRDQIFVLRFRYPEEEAEQLTQAIAIDADRQRAALNAAQRADEERTAKTSEQERLRKQYTYMGSEQLRPIDVYDDTEYTYFVFEPQQELPSFYIVNEDGSEGIVEKHIEPDGTVVVPRIASQFVLRRGASVVCIYNENPPLVAPPRKERHVTERLERIVKGGH